jgi:hypothetical protein
LAFHIISVGGVDGLDVDAEHIATAKRMKADGIPARRAEPPSTGTSPDTYAA